MKFHVYRLLNGIKSKKRKNQVTKTIVALEGDQAEEDHLPESRNIKINKATQKINQINNHKPENFNSDLYRTSNRQATKYKGESESKRHSDTKSRRLYNISLLYDETHPSYHLARALLMKFTIQTIKDCWVPVKQVETREKDINNNFIYNFKNLHVKI